MYRTALRSSARALSASRSTTLTSASRRFASTTAAPRRSTWKGAGLRWALAIGAVYYYNTSPLFADEPAVPTRLAPPAFSEDDSQTVDALIEEKRRAAKKSQAATPSSAPKSTPQTVETTASSPAPAPGPDSRPAPHGDDETAQAAEALEEEAGQQGAFNPETGEINWDCPCLGGMAHGPCGEEFRAAFSCFVYSNEEPKGMECIDKFQHMQDCFRLHPEIYAAELADGEDDDVDASPESAAATSPARSAVDESPDVQKPADAEATTPATEEKKPVETPTKPAASKPASKSAPSAPSAPKSSASAAVTDLQQELRQEAEEQVIPVQAHDATAANQAKKQ